MEKLVSEELPKVIATQTAKLTFNYLMRCVKERVERSVKLMSKYMDEKVAQGDTWRNDWFAENEVSNRHIPLQLLEKTIKEIINDSQERKSVHIAKFWVNVCGTSNSNIDEATAFSYFKVIESLSWRQLCIIRLIVLCRNQAVDLRHISGEDVEQMPQDEQARFYFISREYEELMDNHYIESASIMRSSESNDM
ncbi:MAG: hypothetical protein F4X55_04225 [Candidatus Dadabacteria bacterium]|nr:hypothetical protein [Candidatus Dadabacteria bacterium]